MRSTFFALAAAAVCHQVTADCPNACSGNGECTTNYDVCSCFEGFIGSDCSERVCPFGLAFVDVPQGDLDHDNQLHSGGPSANAYEFPSGVTNGTALNPQIRPQGWWERHPSQLYGTYDQGDLPLRLRAQEGHFSAECSAVGVCDRSSGTCSCFAGYEGNACQRTECPNDCSGHGVCRTQSEYLDIVSSDFEYGLWDADKYQRCICDGGYSGTDCSDRLCPLGDDPLTTTGTQIETNDGLTETGEVQYLDIRCPYNGDMIDPSVAIVYTDANTGAQYQTAFFDPTVATTANAATVMAALKDLPNGVLADFAVDGVTTSTKVQSVSIAELETDNFYRITVTFDESMGDVPALSGEAAPSMICSGGARVNTKAGDLQTVHENIAVIPVGDGPREYLKFRIQVIDNATQIGDVNNPSIFEYQVFDQFGNVLNDVDVQTHRPAATSGASLGTAEALTNAALFSREAAKLTFVWEFGEGKSGVQDPSFDDKLDRLFRNNATREDNLIYEIEYFVEPTFMSHNQRFMLTGEPVGIVFADDDTAHNITLGTPTDTSPTYDIKFHLEILEDDHSPMALYMNDEFIAYANNSISSLNLNQDLFAAIPTGFDGGVPTNGADFIGPANMWLPGVVQSRTTTAGDSYTFYLPKTPITVASTGPEDVLVDFRHNNAPVEDAVTIVLKFVQTSTSNDRYVWKVAGDADFVVPSDTSVPGFNVSANYTRLGEAEMYSAMHPDDPIRSSIENLFVYFPEGADFDERVCATQSTTPGAGLYYIQVGMAGINDHPECSARGLCDSSTGMCNCFSGYAGLDCSEQNALAGGGGGSFAL